MCEELSGLMCARGRSI